MKECRKKDYKDYNTLYERLAMYAESDYYPFHMPGHKRAALEFENPYQIDITEIEGFDNLHHAEDILEKAQERLSRLYHSRKSYYLVNGSTCGLLSAVGALTKPGEKIIIARNCHKSVYNAVKIFGLKADYVYPEILECGIQGKINPEQVETVLKKQQNTGAVVITSPTYDGIVSDIRKIAQIVRKYNSYLIVDEAHGAHFSFSRYFPESAITKGADIVIHSLHKTLPCFTQTAALHVAAERVDLIRIEEMLSIFQSSSPSYVLMAGIEQCIKILEESGKELFEKFEQKLDCFYKSCEQFRCLHVITGKDYKFYHEYDVDRSKILISTWNSPINGERLYSKLWQKYHLQMEMYSADYVLAMTSIMDTQEGFDRLIAALDEIDHELFDQKRNQIKSTMTELKKQNMFHFFIERIYAKKEKALEISETDYYNKEETLLEKSKGKICAEYIYLYPPGIPVIAPGEVISSELIEVLEDCRKIGLNVQGTKDKQYRKILTVAQTV